MYDEKLLNEVYLEGLFYKIKDYDEEDIDIILMEYLINEGYTINEIIQEDYFYDIKDKFNIFNEGFLKNLLLGIGAVGATAAASYGYGKHIMNQADKDVASGAANRGGWTNGSKDKLTSNYDGTINQTLHRSGNTLGRINNSRLINDLNNNLNNRMKSHDKNSTTISLQSSRNGSLYTVSQENPGKHYVTNFKNGEKVGDSKEMGVMDYMKVGLKGVTSRFNKNLNYTSIDRNSNNNNNNNNNNSAEQTNVNSTEQTNNNNNNNNNNNSEPSMQPKFPKNAPEGYNFIGSKDGFDYYVDPKTNKKIKVGPSQS